jgi:hypothetical protein
MSRLIWILFAAFVIAGALSNVSNAKVFLTQEHALALAFPSPARAERKSAFLTDGQVKQIEQAACSKLDTHIVTYYIGRSSAGVSGYAFFDTHQVRTMPETLMTVIDPSGHVVSVELLSFNEPEDFKPPQRWLELFRGKQLTEDLWIKRGVRNITGASLSSQAVTDAVRRALATYEVVKEKGAK